MLFLMIFISSMMAISCQSWIMVWMFMEINTLTLCGFSFKEMKLSAISKPMLIYFLIQILASILFLMTVLTMKNSNLIYFLATTCLLLKMGVWPLHFWYIKTLSKMEFFFSSMKMIMTWQKLIPIFFLSFFNTKFLLIILSMLSMITPLSKTSKKTNLHSIMILSSMNNNGWLILSKLSSLSMFFLFYMLYSLSIVLSLTFFKNSKHLSMSLPSWNSFMVVMNMLSLPPSMMFLSKLVIVFSLTPILSNSIIAYMMITSCYFSFFYLKTTFLSLFFNPLKNQLFMYKEKKKLSFMIILISLLSPFVIF